MCTVSAIRENGTFSLFFNRDEKLERQEALPPRLWTAPMPETLSFLAPLDPQGGGSWLTVNSAALIVGLLNNYETSGSCPAHLQRSRGLLVTQLAPLPSLEAISSRLTNLDLALYAPFYLFVCSPGARAMRCWSWNGIDLEQPQTAKDPWLLTTSSLNREVITSHRRACFERTIKNRVNLERLHYMLDAEKPERSFRIIRKDARTVSISRIDISNTEILFRYHSLGGELQSEPTIHSLPRALRV